jgi:predicted DsbA family dithiol-disulfide isomerase
MVAAQGSVVTGQGTENRQRVIDDNQREAMAMGVNAIPAHVFGRRFLVIGAYPDEYFRQVLRRLEDPSRVDNG